jgi:hypothetical protein
MSFLTILLICSGCGGGGSSPTTPTSSADISGVWSFSGQMTRDTCTTVSPRFPSSATEEIEIVIDDVEPSIMLLTAYHRRGNLLRGDVMFLGMADSRNNSFELMQEASIIAPDLSYGWYVELDTNNIRGNSATGTMTATVVIIAGGTCQVVWTGNWTKS